jgi:hypothetical protein
MVGAPRFEGGVSCDLAFALTSMNLDIKILREGGRL